MTRKINETKVNIFLLGVSIEDLEVREILDIIRYYGVKDDNIINIDTVSMYQKDKSRLSELLKDSESVPIVVYRRITAEDLSIDIIPLYANVLLLIMENTKNLYIVDFNYDVPSFFNNSEYILLWEKSDNDRRHSFFKNIFSENEEEETDDPKQLFLDSIFGRNEQKEDSTSDDYPSADIEQAINHIALASAGKRGKKVMALALVDRQDTIDSSVTLPFNVFVNQTLDKYYKDQDGTISSKIVINPTKLHDPNFMTMLLKDTDILYIINFLHQEKVTNYSEDFYNFMCSSPCLKKIVYLRFNRKELVSYNDFCEMMEKLESCNFNLPEPSSKHNSKDDEDMDDEMYTAPEDLALKPSPVISKDKKQPRIKVIISHIGRDDNHSVERDLERYLSDIGDFDIRFMDIEEFLTKLKFGEVENSVNFIAYYYPSELASDEEIMLFSRDSSIFCRLGDQIKSIIAPDFIMFANEKGTSSVKLGPTSLISQDVYDEKQIRQYILDHIQKKFSDFTPLSSDDLCLDDFKDNVKVVLLSSDLTRFKKSLNLLNCVRQAWDNYSFSSYTIDDNMNLDEFETIEDKIKSLSKDKNVIFLIDRNNRYENIFSAMVFETHIINLLGLIEDCNCTLYQCFSLDMFKYYSIKELISDYPSCKELRFLFYNDDNNGNHDKITTLFECIKNGETYIDEEIKKIEEEDDNE